MKKTIVTIISTFLFISCMDSQIDTGPLAIIHEEEPLTLSWEDDHKYIESGFSVENYNLYYRELGKLTWIYLNETGSDETVYTIFVDDIGYGKYEFAIEAVYKNGNISEKHTSTDYSAWPPCGWYIDWKN